MKPPTRETSVNVETSLGRPSRNAQGSQQKTTPLQEYHGQKLSNLITPFEKPTSNQHFESV